MQSTDIKRYQLQSLSFFVRPFAPFLILHKWGKPIPSQQVAILTNAINASLFRGVFFINMDFHFTDFLQGDGAAWCRIRLLFRLAALRGGYCHKWQSGYDSLFESVSNPPKRFLLPLTSPTIQSNPKINPGYQ